VVTPGEESQSPRVRPLTLTLQIFSLFYEEKIEESVAKTTLTLGEESVFRERTGDRRRRYLGALKLWWRMMRSALEPILAVGFFDEALRGTRVGDCIYARHMVL
jgi:hypothetical protein